MKKRLLALLLALVMVFALAACGGGGTNETKELMMETNAGNVNPLAMRNSGPESYGIYEMLYTSEDGIGSDMVPWLADATRGGNNELGLKGMDHEVDSGVYYFYIYDYIKDSAGNTITAEDVVFSFEQTLAFGQASGWGAIEGWEAVDATTIKMTCSRDLNKKGEIENVLLRCFIFSKKAYEASPSEFQADACGTGRYEIAEDGYVQGVSVTLVKRDDYWQTNEDLIPRVASGNIDKIVCKVITDNNTKVMAVQSGDLDVLANIPVGMAADLDPDQFDIHTFPQNGITYVEPNCSEDSIMSDVNMRLAVFYALSNVDIVSVMNAAAGGSEVYYPISAFGHDLFPDYLSKWEDEVNYVTEQNLELSKQYMQKAGYNNEEITLIHMNDTTGGMENVLNMLVAAGFNVKATGYDFSSMNPVYADSSAWDLYFTMTNSSDYMTNLYDHAFNNGGEGATKNFINDDELNALMKKAYSVTATDEDMDNLWQHIVKNAYTCPLYRYTNAMVLPAGVISDFWMGDKNNLLLGACIYAD